MGKYVSPELGQLCKQIRVFHEPLNLGGFFRACVPKKSLSDPTPHPEVQKAKAAQSNVWARLSLHCMHIWYLPFSHAPAKEQDWFNKISNSGSLTLYKNFKQSFEIEHYLNVLSSKFRNLFTEREREGERERGWNQLSVSISTCVVYSSPPPPNPHPLRHTVSQQCSTVGFLLLQCSSGVVRHPRDLQVSVATRFCRVLIFVSS